MTQPTPRIASTELDIEHLFDAGWRPNRTDVPVVEVLATTECSPAIPPRRSSHMAMIRVEPVEVHVRTGWFDGTPREITWDGEHLAVTRLNAVREEAAAYPVITGPRTLFDVETQRARVALTYLHRSRRWTITALDEEQRAAA
jgi:hypothetical protein